MKTALPALVLAPLLLSACATVDTKPAPDPAPATQPQNVAKADEDTSITGSRIPGKRTDRLVRSIGSQDYKDAKAATVNPLNSQ